jgi:hypothetical protein
MLVRKNATAFSFVRTFTCCFLHLTLLSLIVLFTIMTDPAPPTCYKARCNNAGNPCSARNCDRFSCTDCLNKFIAVNSLVQPKVGDEVLSHCPMKRCHAHVSRYAASVDNGTLHWQNDGKNGEMDPNNSEAILMEWISIEGNYDLYRGSQNGKKKDEICAQVADKMNKEGVLVKRTGVKVRRKIVNLEESFVKAYEWTKGTGAGVKETDPPGFEAYVKKICPYYDELLPVMGSRAKTRPVATTDDADLRLGLRELDASSCSDNNDNEEQNTDTTFYDAAASIDNNNNQSDNSSTAAEQEDAGNAGTNETDEDTGNAFGTPHPAGNGGTNETDEDAGNARGTDPKKRSMDSKSAKKKRAKKKDGTDSELAEFAQETRRHNIKMEELQQEKFSLEKKVTQHDFKMKLFKDFLELRKQRVSDKVIRKNFPDMVPFLDDHGNSSSEEEGEW